jgi:hypothetical protein
MVAYAAAGRAPGAARPVLGSVKVESSTSVALENGSSSFHPWVTETNFLTLSREQVRICSPPSNRGFLTTSV